MASTPEPLIGPWCWIRIPLSPPCLPHPSRTPDFQSITRFWSRRLDVPCLAYLAPNVRNRRLHNVIAPATRFESQQLFRPPRPLRPSRSSPRHLIHDDMATAPMTWPSVGFLV